MSTLFDTDNRSAGWHLNSLEIYNWGTFHEKIYRMAPRGRNSLLTGANGSGKTTVVDALITLLVPPGKRHYNQSSGSDRKKERDETSYFLGAYGTLRDEESTGGSTQYLRTKDDFSILLASFANESFQQEATLAQVRWFSSGVLKRTYILSTSALEIERDMIPFDGSPAWKKALSARHPVKFFDTFALYGQAFSSLFGLRSEKALSLFSHVVGVKVLGDLNEFIRENMLDLADMEEDFLHLKKNYDDLLSAHKQIEKAREQLKLLEPVVERGGAWLRLRERKLALDAAFDAIHPVFAAQETHLLTEAVQKEQSRLIAADSRRSDLDTELDGLRRKERDLEFSLRDNRLSDLLQGLERDQAHRKTMLDAKKKRADEYDELARSAGLPTLSTDAIFWQSREEAARQKNQAEEQAPLLANTWADQRHSLKAIEEICGSLQTELSSLEKRDGQIPLALSDLRRQLCEDLQILPSELLFWGEAVRPSDPVWRPALERLLRPLGLSLLVPKTRETEIRSWVAQRHLQETLRLFFLTEESEEHFFITEEEGLLLDVLEFRSGIAYTEALRAHLRKHWDFRLCSDEDALRHCVRGIDQSGWIRDHRIWEKPAEGWDDPTSFILGWDNAEKIRLLKRKLFEKQEEAKARQNELEELSQRREQLDEKRIAFEKLLDYQSWSELDWQSEATELEDIKKRQAELTDGATDFEALQNRLADLRVAIRDKSREKDDAAGFIGRIKKTLEEYAEEEKNARRVLADLGDLDLEAGRALLEPWLREVLVLLDLKSLSGVRDEVMKAVTSERKSKTEDLKVAERELETSMHKFVNPGAELAQRFPEWTGETASLMAKTDYLDEFEKLFNRIRQEDLPGHQKRFKEWLNQRLVEDIADFKTSLENHQRAILETVRELNASLKTIAYNSFPATFIQLHAEESRDAQIRDFRKMLREALQIDIDGDLEKAFHRIRQIIQSLSENEDWRRKVTDVRNWLQFAAVEKYEQDGTQRQYYQDSQSLSGGEKAKLAYTILASAIAHQFGIRRDGVASRSFRFAVVDEAFSKVDPENSKFAMNLFEQLNLQLMVVTPLDKINVVEDYIHTIHYVENKRRKTSSVYDLSIEAYRAPQKIQEPS